MTKKHDAFIRTILTIPLIGIFSYYLGIISVPILIVDTTPIIHVEKVVPSPLLSPVISWASFYDYSLTGIPMYSDTHATAASRFYPRGSILSVTGVDSGKTVEARVNDYGPEACLESNNYMGSGSAEDCTEREIDLSSYAYKQICSIPKGLCKVIINKI